MIVENSYYCGNTSLFLSPSTFQSFSVFLTRSLGLLLALIPPINTTVHGRWPPTQSWALLEGFCLLERRFFPHHCCIVLANVRKWGLSSVNN